MLYVIMLIVGFASGGVLVYVLIQKKYLEATALRKSTDARLETLRVERDSLTSKENELQAKQQQYDIDKQELMSRIVSYKELVDENTILKRDLQNIDVNVRKLRLDTEIGQIQQAELAQRTESLAKRFLKDNVKWISSSLTSNNYSTMHDRLTKVIKWCRDIGFVISPDEEKLMVGDLKAEFEEVVRLTLKREEQARIKAQLREDQKIERELERERQQAERERQQYEREQMAIADALEKAMKESSNQHSDEIERLRSMLKDAEEKVAEAADKFTRAISQAQLTKAGHVYVISNLGSFGGDVFKVGMTRRLEPLERVAELGDASVPFPFDVHMMISCNDAPALEHALHRELNKVRINRTNPRKEFFRTDIETIRKIVVANHGEVDYVADQEALQYWASKEMREEDAEFIDHVYETADGGRDAVIED